MLLYYIDPFYNGKYFGAKRPDAGFHGHGCPLRGPRSEGVLQEATRDEAWKEERRGVTAIIVDQCEATASAFWRHSDVRRHDSGEGKVVF